MRILVTGGTGFVGGHAVPALVAAGHHVRVMARSVHGSLPEGVEFVPGTVTDVDSIRAAAEGMEACLHLVAVIVERGGQTFHRINAKGTEDVVRACADAGVTRFVHQSALGVREGLDAFPYLHTKWLGEEAVRASSLAWTILRPGALFGEGAGFFRPIVWNLRWLPIHPLPNGGRTKFQPLFVQDLARCIVACFEGTGVGETVEIGGPEVLSFRDLTEVVMDALGKRRPMVPVPLWGARIFATMQELRKEPLVTNKQLSMVVLDNVTDLDSVERRFGFVPSGMRETDLRWLAKL
ncbi:MAG TPA: NAD(P)H-binding protein [Actinomycetota bacterium]